MVVVLGLGQGLQSSPMVILEEDSSTDGIVFSLRVGRVDIDHFLNSKGKLSLKI